MRDLKYLIAYIIPLITIAGFWFAGPLVFLVPLVVFGIIPALEMLFPGSDRNYLPDEESLIRNDRFYDYLLYSHAAMVWLTLGAFLYSVSFRDLQVYEIIGLTWSSGIVFGGLGINVAHELGHRANKFEQHLSKILLLPSLYMHFFIEHNRGHHKHVSTPKDPATSRKGEWIYAFYIRSVVMGYLSAWKIENARLRKAGQSILSLQNQMIRFQLIQAGLLLAILLIFGWVATGLFLIAATMGFLMLETVNYLEHYGLMRKEVSPGVYERVEPRHSWNSNHLLGRIFLFELTRHSDHHYLASRKYQILRHFEEAPQLPSGYPAMMVLSLVPPLWFKVMNRELEKWEKQKEGDNPLETGSLVAG
jgi:alkane 1-monooxygenase